MMGPGLRCRGCEPVSPEACQGLFLPSGRPRAVRWSGQTGFHRTLPHPGKLICALSRAVCPSLRCHVPVMFLNHTLWALSSRASPDLVCLVGHTSSPKALHAASEGSDLSHTGVCQGEALLTDPPSSCRQMRHPTNFHPDYAAHSCRNLPATQARTQG